MRARRRGAGMGTRRERADEGEGQAWSVGERVQGARAREGEGTDSRGVGNRAF